MELSEEELQSCIITLEKELFILQRNAEIHGVLDCRLGNVRTSLDKMRKVLGEYDAIRD